MHRTNLIQSTSYTCRALAPLIMPRSLRKRKREQVKPIDESYDNPTTDTEEEVIVKRQKISNKNSNNENTPPLERTSTLPLVEATARDTNKEVSEIIKKTSPKIQRTLSTLQVSQSMAVITLDDCMKTISPQATAHKERNLVKSISSSNALLLKELQKDSKNNDNCNKQEQSSSSSNKSTQKQSNKTTNQSEQIADEDVISADDIPTEIWVMIFKLLDDQSICQLFNTCYRFYQIYTQFVTLHTIKYLNITLYSCSKYVDAGGSEVPETIKEETEITKFILVRDTVRGRAFSYNASAQVQQSFLVIYHPQLKRSEAERTFNKKVKSIYQPIYAIPSRKTAIRMPDWAYDEYLILSMAEAPIKLDKLLLTANCTIQELQDCEYANLALTTVPSPGKQRYNLYLEFDYRRIDKILIERAKANDASGIYEFEKENPIILQVLQDICRSKCNKEKKRFNWNRINYSKFQVALPERQPSKITLPLKEYQLRAVSWMKIIEVKVQKPVSFCNLVRVPGFNAFATPGIDSNETAKIVCSMKNPTHENFRQSFTIRGGILADEMGMGKTITCIALIAASPKPTDAFMLRREHHSNVVEVKTTLIICPNQLVPQWKKEVESHSSLTVDSAVGITQLKKLTSAKIKKLDVFVISHQLLENKSYISRGDALQITNIGWHRIIVDEAHELLAATKKKKLCIKVSSLQSNYRWYVSGTPFPNMLRSFKKALKFLDCSLRSEIKSDNFALFSAIKAAFYWRNLMSGVGKQCEIPAFVEEVNQFTLLPIEQALYNAAQVDENSKEMRMICSNALKAKFTTRLLTDSSSKLYQVPKQAVKRLNERLSYAKKHLKSAIEVRNLRVATRDELISQKSSDATVIDRIDRLRGDIVYHNKRIAKHEESIVRYIAQRSCFDNVLNAEDKSQANTNTNSKKEEDDNTNTSYNNIPVSQLTTEQKIAKMANCVGSKMARVVIYLADEIGKDKNAKIIVFSKYDEVLTQLSELAEEYTQLNKTQFVFCKGNATTRAKAIRLFNAKDDSSKTKKTKKKKEERQVNVMLLSLSNSASGTHLAIADKVLLLDPITGSKEEAKAQDAQAIGRSHRMGQSKQVTVVRFIVQDSIEQEDYERIYETSL